MFFAVAAGVLVPHMLQDVNDRWLEVELLAHLRADALSFLAAAGTRFFFCRQIMFNRAPLQMVGKLLSTPTASATVRFYRRLGNFLLF